MRFLKDFLKKCRGVLVALSLGGHVLLNLGNRTNPQFKFSGQPPCARKGGQTSENSVEIQRRNRRTTRAIRCAEADTFARNRKNVRFAVRKSYDVSGGHTLSGSFISVADRRLLFYPFGRIRVVERTNKSPGNSIPLAACVQPT